MWGIHSDELSLDFVEDSVVAIGWELGDLQRFKGDLLALKARLVEEYPEAKPGAIPVWAGVLNKFAFVMEVGDIVVAPQKRDRTIAIGVISSDYRYEGPSTVHPHRRSVTWTRSGIPRSEFSQAALFEIGSALTLFQVKKHRTEFEAALAGVPNPSELAPSPDPEAADDQLPSADQIDQSTKDQLIFQLLRLDPARFEELTASLLRALGYKARATQYVGDGGVDVIAHRDPLGVEPPILKVQCKRTEQVIGAPPIQALKGTLGSAGEFGVFVTLGGFTTEALRLERSSHDIRLIGGDEFVQMLLENYEDLADEWRREFPLRSVYVYDSLTGSD